MHTDEKMTFFVCERQAAQVRVLCVQLIIVLSVCSLLLFLSVPERTEPALNGRNGEL